MKRLLYALPLMLAACVADAPTEDNPRVPPAPPMGNCGADDLQDLVGQPESVLKTIRFGVPTRVVHPGDAVTLDYLPERLNIEINKSGNIHRLSCG